MIRAVVFDCFGVLCADGWLPFKEAHFMSDPGMWQKATELNVACDSGQLPYEEFVAEIAKLADVPESEVRQAIDTNPVNTEIFEYIKALKSQYKIGLLSNAGADWLNEIFRPEQIALFDAIALSYETGFTKPKPEAFQIIADRLNVAPSECILIDDQERYLTGAEVVGMQTVLYNSLPQLQIELEELLNQSAE